MFQSTLQHWLHHQEALKSLKMTSMTGEKDRSLTSDMPRDIQTKNYCISGIA